MKKYIKETIKYCLRSPIVVSKYIREVEALCAMTPDEMKAYKDKRFLVILQKAYNGSAFYRKFYDESGVVISDIRGIEDIDKLPILTKDMILEHAEEMLTEPKWKMVKAHTSGTTGTPLQVFETWPSLWREQAYLYCYRKRCGFMMGRDILVSLRGHLSAHELKLWVGTSRTQYLSSYALLPETTQAYHDIIIKRNPKAIEGFPSSLYILACNLEEKDLKCHIPLCFTSSETLFDYQREKIEQVFGTQVYDWFGTTERTIQLCERIDHNGYFESPGYSINEYLHDGTLTTSLINDGFPLIRYRGSDVFLLANDKIAGIQGRINANIYDKTGRPYSDSSLTFILKGDLPIKYSQFVQQESGHVDLNVVLCSQDADSAEIREKLQSALKSKVNLELLDLTINIVPESQIIYTQSGKFNFVVQKRKQSRTSAKEITPITY